MKPDESFKVGPYLVRLQASASCPMAMPLFFIFRDSVFIGKSLSMPSESDCAWLSRQNRDRTVYASVSTVDYGLKDGKPKGNAHGFLFRKKRVRK